MRSHEYQEAAILAAENELQSGDLADETKENYKLIAEEVYAKDMKKCK